MNTNFFGKTSGSKPGELAEALGDAAEIIAKSIEATAGPLAELIEARANELAKSVEGRATPLAEAVEATVEQLAKSVESRAVPAARAVGARADALTNDLEERLERARQDVVTGVKNFKFGQREGIILGVAVGLFAAVWLIRKMDREAATARLRAAGSRAGEVAQGFGSRVGEATQGLTDKAGALAGQAGERIGYVVQDVGTRAGELVQQARGQGADIVEEAKLRLSGAAGTVEEAEIGSGLDIATRAAINKVVEEAEQIQEEAQEEARTLGLHNGMKVVAFDGTDIGRVQEVREAVFVLNRPKGADLRVPLTEVARIEGTVAYLRIDIGQVTKMGWEAA